MRDLGPAMFPEPKKRIKHRKPNFVLFYLYLGFISLQLRDRVVFRLFLVFLIDKDRVEGKAQAAFW